MTKAMKAPAKPSPAKPSRATEQTAAKGDRDAGDRHRSAEESPLWGALALRVGAGGPTLRRKLSIGAVDDPAEHAADAAAEKVMRMPDPLADGAAGDGAFFVRRVCATCAEEKEEQGPLRRTATKAATAEAPASVQAALRAPGRPLDAGARAFFEPRFGRGLGGVGIHTDAGAAASARAIGAEAYSVGRHIAFGAGRYAPETTAGRRLMAHELAHTLQQPETLHRDGPPVSEPALIRRQPEPEKGGGAPAKAGPCLIHFFQGRTEFTDAKEFDTCMKAAKAFLAGGSPKRVIELHGFASEEGDTPFNQDLSQRRADTVFKLMGMGGVDKARMAKTGHGEDKTFPTLEENRRVEVRLVEFVETPGVEIAGLPCPPRSKTVVTTLEDYQILLACAEKTMGLSARDMLAVFRQLYYGKPWSISKASQWDQVIPCSPDLGNPKGKLGDALFESLLASQEVQGVDVGHVFTGLEAMLCPSSTVSPKAGGAAGSIAGAIGANKVEISNEDFATWGGDLGAAVAAFSACKALGAEAPKYEDCGGKPGGQSLKFYLRNQAPDQDLEGDIDAFVLRAQLMGIPCAGSREKTLDLKGRKASELFMDYYLDPTSALGKAHTNRARCMLEALGARIAGKKVSNRDDIVGPLSVGVASFAEAFYVKIRGVPHTPDLDESLLIKHYLAPEAVKWFLDWLEKRL